MADVCERVPPAFACPVLEPSMKDMAVDLGFIQESWSTEIEHVDERIIVKDVDGRMRSVSCEECFNPNLEKRRRGRAFRVWTHGRMHLGHYMRRIEYERWGER